MSRINIGDSLLSPGSCVYYCTRPENVTIDILDPDDVTSARNVFHAKILHISNLGPFLKISLDCGFRLTSYVTREGFAALKLDVGKEAFAAFKATAVHLIQCGK